MNRLKRVVLGVSVAALVFTGAAFGGYIQSTGVFRVVGDVELFNNDPTGDYSTAIGESPSLRLDGSAGELEFGPGNTTEPDVILSRDAANRLHLGTSDDFVMEGATADAFEMILTVTDPTADMTVTVPDAASHSLGDTYVSWAQGATPADALDSVFYVAPRAMVIKAVRATWGIAESTGSMDVMVEKLVGVTACASGTNVLSAVIDATGTADTTATGALTATGADLQMAAGDTLCVDVSATPNEIANLTVTVQLGIS